MEYASIKRIRKFWFSHQFKKTPEEIEAIAEKNNVPKKILSDGRVCYQCDFFCELYSSMWNEYKESVQTKIREYIHNTPEGCSATFCGLSRFTNIPRPNLNEWTRDMFDVYGEDKWNNNYRYEELNVNGDIKVRTWTEEEKERNKKFYLTLKKECKK